MMRFKLTCAWQIVIALILGIAVGAALHYYTESRGWSVTCWGRPAIFLFA